MNQNSKNAYSPPASVLAGTDADVRYAGFWIRFLASVVDSLWQLPLLYALGFLAYGMEYFDSDVVFKGPIDALIQIAVPMLLTIAFWFFKSATPGKMLFGIAIVNEADMRPASKNQLTNRYLGYYVSILALGFGFLWVGIDKKKQGFHDKLAKTVVIYR